MEIDKYIQKLFDGYPRLMDEMGVKSFIPLMPGDDFDGGVCIRVSAENFEGEIRIELNQLDLFDMSIYDYDMSNSEEYIMSAQNVHVDGIVTMAYELFRRAIAMKEYNKEGLYENRITELITEELKKSDIIDIIKKDKDVEKRIKDIVRDIVKDMYRILYQHNGIFTALGK